MKKWVKKLLFVSTLAVISLFTSNLKIYANTINSIKMDIFLEEDGTGHVTEVWNMKLSEGTEAYKPYGNLDKYNITNFTVKDEDGRVYETINSWNTSANFSSKAYKCGILKKYNGVELCWGMSEYGYKTYTLEYDIEGLVQQLNDAQSIYFSFMPDSMSPAPGSVAINIASNIDFDENNSKIWAFGYDGDINFKNGKIVMTTDGALGYSEYMVALVKFEENIFVPSVEINKEFEEIEKEAKYDSDYEYNIDSSDKNNTSFKFKVIGVVVGIIGTIISLFMNIGVFALFIFVVLYIIKISRKESLDFGPEGKKLPNKNTVDYYRDIPCEGSIYRGYFLVNNYFTFINKNTARSGLMGAIFLKWIKDKRVTIVETKSGMFNIGKNQFALDISKLVPENDEVEEKLINILKEAAGTNEILESREFEVWCYSNYNRLNNWFEYATTSAIKEYIVSGGIVEKEITSKTIFGTKKIKQNFVNPEVKEDAKKLLGLRRFLLDYSLISKREAIEVMLWEDYLVFAQILGIADKVESQFKKLYPEFNIAYGVSVSDVNICIKNLTYSGVSAAARAHSAATSSSSSRSSGSGGHSSSGGGHSSGGRSSGGGTR